MVYLDIDLELFLKKKKEKNEKAMKPYNNKTI